MLKQTARFAALALLMFAASATPLTVNLAQLDSPLPQPDPLPPVTQVTSATPVTVRLTREDSPLPQPDPLPPVTQVI